MPANLKLSEEELRLVTDAEIILTKNRVMDKVQLLFGEIAPSYHDILQTFKPKLPKETFNLHPKIFKGEQYEGLPYVMLDYPRVFARDDVFAVRSFFWWGNFFSINLQLQGKYKERFASNIFDARLKEAFDDCYYCINSDPWKHDFGSSNVIRLQDAVQEQIKQRSFIKLSTKIPLQEWDRATSFYETSFHKIIHLLAN